MPFNVVDQNGLHRGVLLKKHLINDDEYLKVEQKNYWLCALTNITTEDLNFDLFQVKKLWAERNKLTDKNGVYKDSVLREQVLKRAASYYSGDLGFEEALRFLYHRFVWSHAKKEIESKFSIKGYIFIDPDKIKLKDDKLITDLPDNIPSCPVNEFGSPLIAKVISQPRVKLDSVRIGQVYVNKQFTSYKLLSGGVVINLTLPCYIDGCRQGDFILIYLDKNKPKLTLINGMYYDISERAFKLFG